MREVVNLSNNMAFVRGQVPGYEDQHTGEWALIQSAEAKIGTSEWVLVREGNEVKATRRQTVTPQQRIIAWILGVMRIT